MFKSAALPLTIICRFNALAGITARAEGLNVVDGIAATGGEGDDMIGSKWTFITTAEAAVAILFAKLNEFRNREIAFRSAQSGTTPLIINACLVWIILLVSTLARALVFYGAAIVSTPAGGNALPVLAIVVGNGIEALPAIALIPLGAILIPALFVLGAPLSVILIYMLPIVLNPLASGCILACLTRWIVTIRGCFATGKVVKGLCLLALGASLEDNFHRQSPVLRLAVTPAVSAARGLSMGRIIP